MSLDRLIVFAAVAKHRSVSHASEELHISQPAVSKHVRLLEEQYGAKFFTRGGKGVDLTERGKAFLTDVRKLVKRHEQLKEKHGAVRAKAADEVFTVAGSYSPSASLLPSLLARFERTHPRVQLNLRTDTRLSVERMVLRGVAELAVINNPPLNRNLKMEAYRSEPLVAFVAPGHRLSRKKQLDRDSLKNVGFITRKELRGGGSVRAYLHYLAKQGIHPAVIMQCDTPASVKEAVRKKLGIGILYREVVADNIARREFKTIQLPGNAFEGKSFIIYHKKRPLSPYAQEFLSLLYQQRRKPRQIW